MLMLSFVLNYNSAHFIWMLPHGARSPAPMGAVHPGIDHGCLFWAPSQAGDTKRGPFTWEEEVCSMQSLFLQKKGGLGHAVHPKKSQSPSPVSPAQELLWFKGRAVPSCGAARASKIMLMSPATSGAAGFPCFPAPPSLNELKQTRRRTLGQCWVPAGAAAPNRTGGRCFRAELVGAGTAR